MSDPVILGAARTPIGSFNGSLASVSASALGAVAIGAALERAGVSGDQVDEVLMGNVVSAGTGLNPARQASLSAGLPEAVPATSIEKACGSGLKSIALAAQAIKAGDANLVVAGGTENMSAAPYLLEKARTGYRLGDGTLVDSLLRDGLWCTITDCHMGSTAENIAAEFEVSRDDQDGFAARSQRRAADAVQGGRFEAEIAAVEVPRRRGDPVLVVADEYPRPETTEEALAGLRPAFERDGTVTAGNASGINDGAAATLVASRERADQLGVAPLAAIRSYASAGVAPRIMGMGPVDAVTRALERAGLELADIDLIELNEAFAAQSLGVIRELGFDEERVNVNGGAIALGHPVGASGARILTTLLYEMARRDVEFGLATLCIGGGQGIAMVVERKA